MKKIFLVICILIILVVSSKAFQADAALIAIDNAPIAALKTDASLSKGGAFTLAARTQPLIIDHNTIDITAVPQQWIETAKNDLHIYYGHTSHGSQLMYGMDGLVDFANGGGLGLSLPQDTFAGLSVWETAPDAGYYPVWVDRTREHIGPADPLTGRGTTHPEINVVIWSWCGQVSDITEQNLLNEYLLPMTQLENEYHGITFVYMTGHSDGSGETGNLHLRNRQIQQYAINNNKVLYDFYDIELYDPDGIYYGDKAVEDDCDYDSDGNGYVDSNWCRDWQNTHTQDLDWYEVACAHSESLNCNQKAYAAWWLWASIAGWNEPEAQLDLSSSTKMANQTRVQVGDTLTYTVQIVNETGTFTNTVHLADTVPAGLKYVPASLSASSGAVDDSNAPDLAWTGVLTPTPTIKISYGVTVTTVLPQFITNTSIIQSAGYDPIERSATIIANGYHIYQPFIYR